MPQNVLTGSPHCSEAERTLIGALLLDPDAIYKVDNQLHAADFYDPVYRDIYRAAQRLSEEGIAIDFVTISDALQGNKKLAAAGGPAFLAKLCSDVPTSSHVLTYAQILREKSRRRQLEAFGRHLCQQAADESMSADELTESAERSILKLSQTAADDPARLSTLRSDRFDHYAALHEAGDTAVQNGIRTGFADIDARLIGLTPGQLIVLAGRPGIGKTALALDIAMNVASDQRKSVCVFSLEMTKEELFTRLIAKRLAVPSHRIENGTLSEDEFAGITNVLDQFADYPLFIDDDANTTLVNIRSKARRQQLKHRLDLLVIDYLQLIEVTDRLAGENQTQRITYISKSLKQLARELQCPVLALSQLSRACDNRPDKRPQLSDLRDSGSIEQDGDRILMLYRESEYNEDCDDPDLTDLYIRKNRHGPKGHVELRFDRDTMSFVEYEGATSPCL